MPDDEPIYNNPPKIILICIIIGLSVFAVQHEKNIIASGMFQFVGLFFAYTLGHSIRNRT